MLAMGLLGLLVGVALLLAAAALVRYLSQTPSSVHIGASPRTQAAPVKGVGGDRLADERRPACSAIRGRILIAAGVWSGAALLAGVAMLFIASDDSKRQPAPMGGHRR